MDLERHRGSYIVIIIIVIFIDIIIDNIIEIIIILQLLFIYYLSDGPGKQLQGTGGVKSNIQATAGKIITII